MAKRFTDSEKWRDPWFCELPPNDKLFWIYLLDNCDFAGFWQPFWPLVQVCIPGYEFNETFFRERVTVVTPKKWHIPKFIHFQYGELNSANRLHHSVILRLKKEGLYMPLISPLQGAKEQDKEKDKDFSLASEKGEAWRGERRNHVLTFERFWAAYPKKKSKGDAFKAWRTLNPSDEQVSRILAAIDRAKTSADWVKEGGQFIPYPATWIRATGWEDEVTVAVTPQDDFEKELQRRRELSERADAIIANQRIRTS